MKENIVKKFPQINSITLPNELPIPVWKLLRVNCLNENNNVTAMTKDKPNRNSLSYKILFTLICLKKRCKYIIRQRNK